MSDASEHPVESRRDAGPDHGADHGPDHGAEAAQAADPGAWAAACQEDLDAEQARRQQRYGRPPADPARELRLLADAVTEQLGRLGAGFGLGAGPLVAQARSALEPVIERNADTWQHLAAAGQELLAAYRSAVERQERSWTRPGEPARPERRPQPPRKGQGPDAAGAAGDPEQGHDGGDEPGAAGSHRIDLD